MRMGARLPHVKLENFEGPFDLLVELARKQKVSLTEISLKEVTDDFLAYLENNVIPINLQSDFLVVAATLLLLKARQITPTLTPEEEEEVYELTERVQIYQLYRNQAEKLITRWDNKPLFPVGFWGSDQQPVEPEGMPKIVLGDIGKHMKSAIAKLPKPLRPAAHLVRRGRSLSECLSLFQERLKQFKQFTFQETLHGASKQDTAISFLAVLELARQKEITLEQKSAFDTLTISKL